MRAKTTSQGRRTSWEGAAHAGRRRQVAGWLFLAPAILYLLFAFALPIAYNVMLSFEQSSPESIASFTAPFAGLANNAAMEVNGPWDFSNLNAAGGTTASSLGSSPYRYEYRGQKVVAPQGAGP